MCPDFFNMSLLEDEKAVSVSHGREAVGDEDGCLPLAERLE
jgi:hypothetical protein